MRISEFLRPDAILADLRGRDAASVFAEVCGPVARSEGIEPADLVRRLLAREALSSTGVGDGVALPHARHPGLRNLAASFGRSREGVVMGPGDGSAVRLYFAIFTPEHLPAVHLKALARAANLLRARPVREALLDAAGPEEIYRVLCEADR